MPTPAVIIVKAPFKEIPALAVLSIEGIGYVVTEVAGVGTAVTEVVGTGTVVTQVSGEGYVGGDT